MSERTDPALSQELGRAILGTSAGATTDTLALVRRTAAAEEIVRDLLRHAVGAARADGHSWAALGAELGMSRQAVQQRFGARESALTDPAERWLGPVTAFDEMSELALAGELGWHTVEAGMLRHRMVRTATRWEHKRVIWSGSLKRYERDGWQVGCRAFPWIYLVRDTGVPVADR